jgi:AraC family transcriptional regulator
LAWYSLNTRVAKQGVILSRVHDAMTYDQRLERVALYIEKHLGESFDLNTLADIAHLSPYHFHRIYHAIAGETIAATVKRLRLHRAAGYLVQTSMGIAQIAKSTGYQNVQSFTRIFKTEFDLPPAQYRKQGTHTRFQATTTKSALSRDVSILELAPMSGVGLVHRGSFMMIKRSFDSVYRWVQANGLSDAVTKVIGIYDDDPFTVPEAQLRSRACLILSGSVSVEPPIVQVNISGGICAVLRHQGPYADMRLAYQWLYGQWLPRSGYLVADAPVFEVYLNHPRDTKPADLLVDICLPLQPLLLKDKPHGKI